MAELIFFLGLAGPFLLMAWLLIARRRATAKVAAIDDSVIEMERFATEEGVTADNGLVEGRRHMADHEIIPPDATGGEPAGIRAIQGRR